MLRTVTRTVSIHFIQQVQAELEMLTFTQEEIVSAAELIATVGAILACND